MSGAGSAGEQAAAHVGPLDQGVLRRRRGMIDARHVDAGPMVEEVVGNLDGPGLVERLLTVSAAEVNGRGIGSYKPLEFVEPPEPCGRVRGQRRTTSDQKRRGLL